MFSILLVLASILRADEPADIKAINLAIGALYVPQVRADPKRMAEVTTPDLDGELGAIPVRTIWCETACEGFRVTWLKFVTVDVAVVEGETTGSVLPPPMWLMVLKKDRAGWRISSIHVSTFSPTGRIGRSTNN